MLTKLITVKNINLTIRQAEFIECVSNTLNDLKLCLKIHQVVFKILNSRFMVAFPQSRFKKKQNTARKNKHKSTKILNKPTKNPNPNNHSSP